jgi:enterochelin esterase family protein
MRPRMRGTLLVAKISSRALRGNPLGDPWEREVYVLLPPGYRRRGSARYPVVYFLVGFTGRASSPFQKRAWDETLDEQVERLRRARRIGRFLLVVPDAFTRLGGSQYIDSPAVGRYGTYITREIPAWTDARFRTVAHRDARAIMGKSSGGYGALISAMRRPDVFGLCACHSGDMSFEHAYLPDVPEAADAVRRCGGTVRRFLQRFFRACTRSRRDWMTAINLIAMSACYAPRRGTPGGVDVPWDERTGAIRRDVWRRFRRHDPVVLALRHARALRSLRLFYLDCGTRDEFRLHHGARILHDLLRRLRVRHIYEEFEGGHFGIAHRYDRSLTEISRVWRPLRIC